MSFLRLKLKLSKVSEITGIQSDFSKISVSVQTVAQTKNFSFSQSTTDHVLLATSVCVLYNESANSDDKNILPFS